MRADDALSAAVSLKGGEIREKCRREQTGVAEPAVRTLRRNDLFGVRRARFKDAAHARLPEKRLIANKKKHSAARLCGFKSEPDGEGNALLRRAVAHGEKAAPLTFGEDLFTAGHDRDAREKLLRQNVHCALEKAFAVKFREQLPAAEAQARSRGQKHARNGALIHPSIHFPLLPGQNAGSTAYKLYKYYAKKDDRLQELSKRFFEMFNLHKIKKIISANIRPFATIYI